VLAKKVNLISNPDLQADVVQLYENIMAISRRQQRSLVLEGQENPYLSKIMGDIAQAGDPIEHPRVVYQGEPGAYSEMAAVDFFGEDIHAVGLEQFEDVFLALKEGRADYGVVPIENSSTGAIRQIYDLMTQHDCFVVGETTVAIQHCLMALPGVKLEDIQTVYSHEQGLFQCEQYLNKHSDWNRVPQADTAVTAPRQPFAASVPPTSTDWRSWRRPSTATPTTPPASWSSPPAWSCGLTEIRSAPASACPIRAVPCTRS